MFPVQKDDVVTSAADIFWRGVMVGEVQARISACTSLPRPDCHASQFPRSLARRCASLRRRCRARAINRLLRKPHLRRQGRDAFGLLSLRAHQVAPFLQVESVRPAFHCRQHLRDTPRADDLSAVLSQEGEVRSVEPIRRQRLDHLPPEFGFLVSPEVIGSHETSPSARQSGQSRVRMRFCEAF